MLHKAKPKQQYMQTRSAWSEVNVWNP